MKFRTLLATLLLLVVTMVATSVQGVLYPNDFVLNKGTVSSGSFPGAVTTSDNIDLYIVGEADGPVWYMDFEFRFDLNPQKYNRVVIESRSDWNLLSTCAPCFRVDLLVAGSWTTIIDVIYWTTDTVEFYDLTTQQAQERNIRIRLYHQDVGSAGKVYFDHLYIQSWNTDDDIVAPPGDEEPEDNKTAGDDTSFVDSDWFNVVACLIIFLIAFALLTRVTTPVRAFAFAGLIAIFSFLVLTGWIFALLMTVVMK